VKECPYCHQEQSTLYLSKKDYFLTNESFEILNCENCGLHFTYPRPILSKLGSYYRSDQYISHNDSKSGFIGNIYKTVRSYALQKKEELARKESNGNEILDFGCGSGAFVEYLLKKKWKVRGVEFDDEARANVIKKTSAEISKDTTSIKDQSLNIITAWHVLEHVYDLEKTFIELNRILKSNGKLIIALPNYKSHDALYYKQFWAALDVPRHLYHFDSEFISKIAIETGYKLKTIKPMVFDSFYISLISTKYKYGSIKPIQAFFQGLLSNLKANKTTPNHSSLIYILEKNS